MGVFWMYGSLTTFMLYTSRYFGHTFAGQLLTELVAGVAVAFVGYRGVLWYAVLLPNNVVLLLRNVDISERVLV